MAAIHPVHSSFYIFRGIVDEGLTLAGAYEIGDINGDGLMDWVIRYRNDDFSVRWNRIYIGATGTYPLNPSWIIPYHTIPMWNLRM
jgi:hypothetical protein